MKKTSTLPSFPKNALNLMEHSIFDEELAILFRKEQLRHPSETSLKNIFAHSKKTAKKPNLLLC